MITEALEWTWKILIYISRSITFNTYYTLHVPVGNDPAITEDNPE